MFGIKTIGAILVGAKDIVLKVNETMWISGENAEKTVAMVKNGAALSAAGISGYNAAEDFICRDKLCFVLSSVGGTCDLVSCICGNIPVVRGVTSVTVPVSIACKSTRAYCKRFGTLPGCNTTSTVGF